MSEGNGKHAISPGTVEFELDGERRFKLPLVRTVMELDKTSAGSYEEQLNGVIDYIKDKTGHTISLDEADELRHLLAELFAKKKSGQKERIESVQRSLGITESTHSN